MNDIKINGFNDAIKHGTMLLDDNSKDLRGNIFISQGMNLICDIFKFNRHFVCFPVSELCFTSQNDWHSDCSLSKSPSH